MKKIAMFIAAALMLSGCAVSEPDLASKISREDAIRLYNGGIAEAEWLGKLDTISRNIPIDNACSVQLADGFLFYKTDLKDGERWVVDVIPTADAPDSMKALARSFRKSEEPTKEIWINAGVLMLNGESVTEEQLIAEADRLQSIPRSRRPLCRIAVGTSARAGDLMRIQGLLKTRGIDIETVYEENGSGSAQ